MARILFATIGSLGDLHPYMAVALGLQARGHRVVIATSQAHRARVEGAGLAWADMRPEEPAGPRPDLMARAMDPRGGTKFIFRTMIAPAVQDQVADLLAVVGDMDLLVSTSLSVGLPLVANKLGKPWASAVLQPMGLFSATDPPVPPQIAWAVPLHRLGVLAGAPLRVAAHRVTREWGRPVRELRRRIGLPDRADPLGVDQFSPLLNLACSPPCWRVRNGTGRRGRGRPGSRSMMRWTRITPRRRRSRRSCRRGRPSCSRLAPLRSMRRGASMWIAWPPLGRWGGGRCC